MGVCGEGLCVCMCGGVAQTEVPGAQDTQGCRGQQCTSLFVGWGRGNDFKVKFKVLCQDWPTIDVSRKTPIAVISLHLESSGTIHQLCVP